MVSSEGNVLCGEDRKMYCRGRKVLGKGWGCEG